MKQIILNPVPNYGALGTLLAAGKHEACYERREGQLQGFEVVRKLYITGPRLSGVFQGLGLRALGLGFWGFRVLGFQSLGLGLLGFRV